MHLLFARPIIAGAIVCALASLALLAQPTAGGGRECIADLECDDGNPCTADVCLDEACLNVPIQNGMPCADRTFCNGFETCWGGVCVEGHPPCIDLDHCDERDDLCLDCLESTECDDRNPCTFDVCADNSCHHRAGVNGTPCPDGVFCNGPETCLAGECVDGPRPCVDLLHCDESGHACLVDANLVWRPALHYLVVDQEFQMGLYIVPADFITDAEISGVQVNTNWNPDWLDFDDAVVDNPDLWLVSGLPNGTAGCGANNTFDDGDAYYHALGNFPPNIPVAPPGGLLLSTYFFTARAETLAAEISIVESPEPQCETLVVSGAVPGLDILKTMGYARVRVTTTPYIPGDGDGDGLVNLNDFALFDACVTGTDGGLLPDCEVFDFDIDLDVDAVDFAWFQQAFAP